MKLHKLISVYSGSYTRRVLITFSSAYNMFLLCLWNCNFIHSGCSISTPNARYTTRTCANLDYLQQPGSICSTDRNAYPNFDSDWPGVLLCTDSAYATCIFKGVLKEPSVPPFTMLKAWYRTTVMSILLLILLLLNYCYYLRLRVCTKSSDYFIWCHLFYSHLLRLSLVTISDQDFNVT